MKTAIKLENLIAVSVKAYMRSMLCRSQNELIKFVWMQASFVWVQANLVWMQANAAKLRCAVAKKAIVKSDIMLNPKLNPTREES